MILAHKIALDPNETQRIYFAKAAGTARFAWNWALAECGNSNTRLARGRAKRLGAGN